MDRLEEYIRNNRVELDRYEPSPGVWRGIRLSLHKGRHYMIMWLSAAAMIVVVFGTAVLFYMSKERDNYILSRKDADIFMIKSNPELFESEIYYNDLVSRLYSEASPLLAEYPDLERELLNDMSQLDSICADIKKDLKDNVDNQEVIEALITNYRIKTKILEDMLDVLRNQENDNIKTNDDAI